MDCLPTYITSENCYPAPVLVCIMDAKGNLSMVSKPRLRSLIRKK